MPTYSVKVYTRKGSPCWWARCYVEGEGGKDHRWSTGIEIGTNKRQSEREAQRNAETRAAALAVEVHGQKVALSDTALGAVAERLLAAKTADGRRERAVDAIAFNLDKHVFPFFKPERDIRTIRRPDLESFKQKMHGDGYAPTSINNALTAIRQVLKHAWSAEELLEGVPQVANVRVPGDSKGRALTAEEVESLLSHVDPRATEAREFLVFIANTGLRKSEALAVRWSWVDWKRREINIPGEFRKGGKVQKAPTPINDVIKELLEERAKRPRQPTLDRVFFQQKHDGARNSAAERAGLGHVRNHDLRHTFGSLAYKAGATLPEVRDLLGHSTMAMVSRYAHSYPDRLHLAAQSVRIAVPGRVTDNVTGERLKMPRKRSKLTK